jgi:hypothetical protein
MPFHLRRISDGARWSGLRSESVQWNGGSSIGKVHSHEPILGNSILVGSFSSSNVWITTEIVEILEEIRTDYVDYVRFRTLNSEYEWWNGVHPKGEDTH